MLTMDAPDFWLFTALTSWRLPWTVAECALSICESMSSAEGGPHHCQLLSFPELKEYHKTWKLQAKIRSSWLMLVHCWWESSEILKEKHEAKVHAWTLAYHVSLFIDKDSQVFENFIDFTNLLMNLPNALLSLLNHCFIEYNFIFQLEEILPVYIQIQPIRRQ